MKEVIDGRYERGEESYAGGSSDVFVYKDLILDRMVAIKYLVPYRESSRFYDEINALQRIRSKHVIQIYDVIISADPQSRRVGLVLEYIPGKNPEPVADLHQYLKTLYQIASGLKDIHDQDLIHRDIKLENMKIDDEGILKIFDFDLARVTDKAVTNQYKGTPGYSAPELYGGYGIQFTPAIDTYAFGVCALLLAGGTMPKILSPQPPIPPQPGQWVENGGFRKLKAELPPGLADTLDKTLSERPQDRPEMGAIRDAIKMHLLENKHRGQLIVHDGSFSSKILDCNNRAVIITPPRYGSLSIQYTGVAFVVTDFEGEVAINNIAVCKDQAIPESCVIGFGPQDQRDRIFVTFDMSHPEVVF